jgi:hypothetical protein
MKREFPHLFDDKPASVSAPGHGPAQLRQRARTPPPTFPKKRRNHGQDLVERGLIPNMDAYAKHYFEQLEKRK